MNSVLERYWVNHHGAVTLGDGSNQGGECFGSDGVVLDSVLVVVSVPKVNQFKNGLVLIDQHECAYLDSQLVRDALPVGFEVLSDAVENDQRLVATDVHPAKVHAAVLCRPKTSAQAQFNHHFRRRAMPAAKFSSQIVPSWGRTVQCADDGITTMIKSEPLPDGGPLPDGLHTYAYMAARHWQTHCPQYYAQLLAGGKLVEAVVEASDATLDDMDTIYDALWRSGVSGDEAHRSAWEQVRERYILLPAEEAGSENG